MDIRILIFIWAIFIILAIAGPAFGMAYLANVEHKIADKIEEDLTPKSSNFRVAPNKNGGWIVKREGAEQPYGYYRTEAKAITAGQRISDLIGTELIIHLRKETKP